MSDLVVVQIPAGPLQTNAFLVIDPASGGALIIDAPPDSADAVAQGLAQHNATPILLVITHTHWDHIGDAHALSDRFNLDVAVHEKEHTSLQTPRSEPIAIEPTQAARILHDGDAVTLGDHAFIVLETPGHSPGQISLYSEPDRLLFGGDTLFPNGYGRTDIPGASESETISTIQRLLALPDDVTVLTGHGASTTIGRERRWMQHVVDTGRLLG